MGKQIEADIFLLRLIHNNRIELFDSTLLWISKTAYLIAIGIIFCLGWFVFFKKSENAKDIFLKLLLMLSTATLIVISLKYAIHRTRPFDLYGDIVNLSIANSPSFPSGHTVIAFILSFGLLFSNLKRLYYLPVLVWALLVAYSRLALGIHFPTDVIISIIIAFVVTIIFKNFTITKWKQKVL
ncbi:phosphatase PAP2 family protein [Tenacibaculum mesophilum]|uniref:phosphatase PAP2 family protein n=1 Tax=Tenacibaculum mesophilum TaxID=104268 RepID=UPI00069E8CDD|nr:phosphatase PAP2 family protein [Tenacibaculum mesophilum]